MSAPTAASVSAHIDADPGVVYDLIADVSRMGEWSPECVRCEWLGQPGVEGSRFKGHNKSGPFRWTTTAEVTRASRPREFTFATMVKGRQGTRWSYRIEGDGPVTVTESFEAIFTPKLIAVAERLFLRNRQQQLEAGMAATLANLKAAAEAAR